MLEWIQDLNNIWLDIERVSEGLAYTIAQYKDVSLEDYYDTRTYIGLSFESVMIAHYMLGM